MATTIGAGDGVPPDYMKMLMQVLTLLFIILVIVVVMYIIYIIIRYYYPRMFFIGHGEPLEAFMQDYMTDLMNTLYSIYIDPSRSKLGIGSKIQKLFDQKSKYESQVAYVPSVLHATKDGKYATNDRCTPKELPIMYLFFMFGSAIKNKDANECLLVEKFFEDQFNPYTKKLLTDIKKEKEVPAGVIKDCELVDSLFKSFKTTYDAIESKVSKTASSSLNGLLTSYTYEDQKLAILGSYLKQIRTMYDYRKGGGMGNLKFIKLVMGDYNDYIWGPSKDDLEKQGETGIVPDIWKYFLKSVKENATLYESIIASPAVSAYMASMPAKIAGVESFVNGVSTTNIEGFLSLLPPPQASMGDTVETLGFLKALVEIPKFFLVLMDVAQAIATAVASPIKFLRIIIGMVVGTLLYITYIVLVAISPLFYVPAFFVTIAISLYKTIYWVFFYIVIIIFVIVLWILDFLLGGFVLRMFRCENLPNAWLKAPGFLFGNKYRRTTMCNFRCGTRYVPNGSWCSKIPGVRPAFCPQQFIIMGVDAAIATAEPTMPSALKMSPLNHKFSPLPDFYALTTLEKKAVIKEFLEDKYSFLVNCFDKLTENQLALSVAACGIVKDLKESDAFKESDDLKLFVGKLEGLCQDTFCKHEYRKADKGLTAFTGIKYQAYSKDPANGTPFSFCEKVTDNKDINDDSFNQEHVTYKIIYSLLVFSVVLVAFHIIHRHARDTTFDFTRLLRVI